MAGGVVIRFGVILGVCVRERYGVSDDEIEKLLREANAEMELLWLGRE
jgi:hypothetical protein